MQVRGDPPVPRDDVMNVQKFPIRLTLQPVKHFYILHTAEFRHIQVWNDMVQAISHVYVRRDTLLPVVDVIIELNWHGIPSKNAKRVAYINFQSPNYLLTEPVCPCSRSFN